jgi:hypothetical protein
MILSFKTKKCEMSECHQPATATTREEIPSPQLTLLPHALSGIEALSSLTSFKGRKRRITGCVRRRSSGHGSGYDSRESKSEGITTAHCTKFRNTGRETGVAYRRESASGGQQSGDDRKAHHGEIENVKDTGLKANLEMRCFLSSVSFSFCPFCVSAPFLC